MKISEIIQEAKSSYVDYSPGIKAGPYSDATASVDAGGKLGSFKKSAEELSLLEKAKAAGKSLKEYIEDLPTGAKVAIGSGAAALAAGAGARAYMKRKK